MQNGPLPCFLSEQELEALLSHNLSPGQTQFRDGLNRLGFVDVSTNECLNVPNPVSVTRTCTTLVTSYHYTLKILAVILGPHYTT